MRVSLSLVSLLIVVTNATPLDVRAPSDCAAVSTAVTKSLVACKSYKPYCSSVAPASAMTSTVTQTSTKKTTTKILGTQTITVTGTSSAISRTVQGAIYTGEPVTFTETVHQRCTAAVPASNQKRAAASFGPCLSTFEAKWSSADRTAACKCLQTIPTSKVTVKTIVTSTVTKYQETTTATIDSPAKTTSISTVTNAPAIVAPSTTVTTTSYSTIERTSSALANPTSIPAPKSSNSWNWWYVESPWPITLFGDSNTTLLISTNGFISLGREHGGGYGNQHLPTGGKDYWDFQLPDVTFAAYWTGQDVNTNYYWPPQDLAYEVIGESPNRILSFEHRGLENGFFRHYMTSFFEAEPGKAEFYYIDIPTPSEAAQGRSHSTVGVQRWATKQFNEWAFNGYTKIYNGLKLTWDGAEFTAEDAATCPGT